MTTDVILRAEDVHRSFGGVRAVDVDRFEVERGSIVALIGPNGAGKTTFFNVLTGFERADGGTWTFEGHELAGKPAYTIARAGMVRTFQSARVFPRLSVTDNVRLGAQHQRGEQLVALGAAVDLAGARTTSSRERAVELVEWVGLGAKAADLAGTLSGGQRKLLDLARAVMASPTLLMLDEPMAGVNPALRQALLDKIGELPGEGITVLFVEHDMDVVSAVSDRVVCMAEGAIIASGTAGEVAADPPGRRRLPGRLERATCATTSRGRPRRARRRRDDRPGRGRARGRRDRGGHGGRRGPLGAAPSARRRGGPDVSDTAPSDAPPSGNLVEIHELVAGYVPGVDILRGTSLHVGEAEMVGIIGPNGAGKSTLIKAVFGLVPIRSGTVTLAGDGHHRHRRARAGAPRRRVRAAGAQRVRHAERRGEPAHGGVPPRRSVRRRAATRSTTCSPCCATVAVSGPSRSPAVSARCSPWAGR